MRLPTRIFQFLLLRTFYPKLSDSGKDDSEQVDEKQTIETGDDPIAKYKALLSTVADKKKSKSDVDLEVSWGVGLDRDDSGSEIGDVQDTEDALPKKVIVFSYRQFSYF